VNEILLFLSEMILIVPAGSATLLSVVVIGCYIFDIVVLPIRAMDVLMAWHLDGNGNLFYTLVCWCVDLIFVGQGAFLAITYASNYAGIIHLFITDSIGKLKK